MKVSTRLYLAVLPGIVGVLTLAALAYWGEYGRQAPGALVLVAALATAASLWIAWRNTRYVAGRIDALARGRTGPDGDARDELTSIARAMVRAERDGAARQRDAEARVGEYAALLAETAAAVAARLDEVRLPLHILLENRFGELNENQEEMIAAAEAAARRAGASVREAGRIAEMDGGGTRVPPAPVRPVDLVAPLLSAALARTSRAGAAFTADVSPALPRVMADTAYAREALERLLAPYLARAAAGGTLRLEGERVADGVRIRLHDGSPPPAGPGPLAGRLLRAQGAEARISADGTDVVFPLSPPA